MVQVSGRVSFLRLRAGLSFTSASGGPKLYPVECSSSTGASDAARLITWSSESFANSGCRGPPADLHQPLRRSQLRLLCPCSRTSGSCGRSRSSIAWNTRPVSERPPARTQRGSLSSFQSDSCVVHAACLVLERGWR